MRKIDVVNTQQWLLVLKEHVEVGRAKWLPEDEEVFQELYTFLGEYEEDMRKHEEASQERFDNVMEQLAKVNKLMKKFMGE